MLVALAIGASAAHADYRINGHGSGHGVGLAQWGAMGYAREQHRGHAWILKHYFPGTALRQQPGTRIRVRLREAPAARIAGAAAARADGRSLRLDPAATYRITPLGRDRLAVGRLGRKGELAHLDGRVRLSGPGPLRLRGRAENGVSDGSYRGVLELARTAAGVQVVDDVALERYLRGVVPAEMPAGWPSAALRAQAIAARSYALTSLRPDRPFDVFADARSQVYSGVSAEHPATTAAVRDTRATVVKFGGAVARTLFHASSGGRTAAVEEIFGGTPVGFLRAVDDPHDRLSPHHDWTVTLSEPDVQERLAEVGAGTVVDLDVVTRTPSGRAATLRVTGALGVVDIPATRARALLGLRSTWFDVSPAGAADDMALAPERRNPRAGAGLGRWAILGSNQ